MKLTFIFVRIFWTQDYEPSIYTVSVYTTWALTTKYTYTPQYITWKIDPWKSNARVHFTKFSFNHPFYYKTQVSYFFFWFCPFFLNQLLTVHSEHNPYMVMPYTTLFNSPDRYYPLLHNYNITKFCSPSSNAAGGEYGARPVVRWAEQKERQGENKDHCQLAVCLLLVPKKLELSNPVIIARIKNLLLT